jgi:hypothetical protein
MRLAGNLAIIPPIEQLLKGLAAESSAFSASNVAVQVFVMPLYVPSDHIYYLFGGRLGALSGSQPRDWTMSNENESEVMQDILALTHKEAVPFLNRFRSPRDLAEYIGRDVHPDTIRSDPNVAEIEAYSRILANQPPAGICGIRSVNPYRKRIQGSIDMGARSGTARRECQASAGSGTC